MNPNEIPMRLSYLNVTFKGLTFDASRPTNLTDDDLSQLYSEALEHAERPIDEILSDAQKEFGENITSLTRHRNYFATLTSVPLDKLCFDDGHESYGNFRGISIKRGDRLDAFYREYKDNTKIRESLDFIGKHRSFFNEHLPIMIRPFDDMFEVAEGNHRVFAAIEAGETHIPALICSKDKPDNPVMHLDFSLQQ